MTSDEEKVNFMTDMKRVTMAVPREIDRERLAFRKSDDYVRCSYGELVCRRVTAGLKVVENRIGEADKKGV